jgi:hypothetical protein
MATVKPWLKVMGCIFVFALSALVAFLIVRSRTVPTEKGDTTSQHEVCRPALPRDSAQIVAHGIVDSIDLRGHTIRFRDGTKTPAFRKPIDWMKPSPGDEVLIYYHVRHANGGTSYLLDEVYLQTCMPPA